MATKKKRKKHAGGRPRKEHPREKRSASLRPAIWDALGQVARARGARLRRTLSVPDLMEMILLADGEIAREVARGAKREEGSL